MQRRDLTTLIRQFYDEKSKQSGPLYAQKNLTLFDFLEWLEDGETKVNKGGIHGRRN